MIQWDKEMQMAFNKVITHSQNIDDPKTDQLFHTWAKAKEWMYKAIGNRLIYEVPTPVTFSFSQREKDNTFCKFLEYLENICGDSEDTEMSELIKFLTYEKEGFFDNKVLHNWKDVPAGMRLIKAIGRYWKDKLHPATIDAIQVEISRIVQQNNITGTLCLSIHPLDFLSASENHHNWRSCHALDGEYRAGNLSYMADDCTIMAYLKSEEEVILPRFPRDVLWNNKKWRCLMFFDRNRSTIYAGRQYPFFSRPALDLCRDLLFEPFNYLSESEVNGDRVWKENCYKDGSDTMIEVEDGRAFPLRKAIKDGDNALHYNDLLISSYYSPYTLQYKNINYVDTLWAYAPLTVGRSVLCFDCGSHEIYDSDAMVCYDCALSNPNINVEWICECEECGERIDREYGENVCGYWYCNECYEKHFVTCSKCGDTINDLRDSYYYDAEDNLICAHCHKEDSDSSLWI